MYSVFVGELMQNDDNYDYYYQKIEFHVFKTVESAWDWILKITGEEAYPYEFYDNKDRDDTLNFDPMWEAVQGTGSTFSLVGRKIYLIFKTPLE